MFEAFSVVDQGSSSGLRIFLYRSCNFLCFTFTSFFSSSFSSFILSFFLESIMFNKFVSKASSLILLNSSFTPVTVTAFKSLGTIGIAFCTALSFCCISDAFFNTFCAFATFAFSAAFCAASTACFAFSW